MFFVFTTLPVWLQQIAQALPLTWLARGMRSAFLPERLAVAEPGGAWQLSLTLLVLAAWAAAGLALSWRSSRWSVR